VDDLPLLNPPEITGCFVCGLDNPDGLRLRIYREGSDAVAAYAPRPTDAGYPELFHGGLVGLLVDEMLVYAGAAHGLWAMTARVGYRLRRPIPLGAAVMLRGRLLQRSARGYRASVEVRLPDEALVAEGEGTCMLRDEHAAR
jgi:acyl-coenzyme A thioesterase PaaI-like protein